MKVGLVIFSLVIQLATFFKQGLSYNVFTYTQESTQMKERSHALHYKSEFYDFISRTFRLSSGQNVKCKIPVFSTINQNFLPTLEEEFQSGQTNSTIVYTSSPQWGPQRDEADRILQGLQNQCAEYRTTMFLWQFCYKKYMRQFDDVYTMKEANKEIQEDIYAGYFPYYLKDTNLTQYDFNQNQNRDNYFQIQNKLYPIGILYANKTYIINPHISQPNLTESQSIFLSGKVISMQGIDISFIELMNKGYLAIFTKQPIPSSYLSQQLYKMDLEQDEISQYSSTYKYRLNFYTVIDQFILSGAELPENVQVEHFYIMSGEGHLRNPDLLKLYDGIYIYGEKLCALKNLNRNDLIIVYLYNQVIIKRIKKIWHHSLIELYNDNQGFNLKDKDFFIQSIQVFSRYRQYKQSQKGDLAYQFIGNYESYFDFTYYRKEKYISGKYLIGFQYLNGKVGETLLFIYNDKFFTTRIVRVNKAVIEIDQDLHDFSGFIVKANSNQSKQTYYDYYPKNRNIKDPEIRLYNQTDTNNLMKPHKKKFYPKHLSFKKIKEDNFEDSNLLPFIDIQNFSFTEDDLKKQRFLNFVIQTHPITNEVEFKQLKMMITDSQEQVNEAVEINFTNDNQIFAYDVFNKQNIVSKNKRFENTTLLRNITIWILLDTDNSVRLGFSDIISPSTQVLCLQTNYTNLKNFRILTQQTVNYVLLYPYLDVIDKSIDFSFLHPNLDNYQYNSIKQQYYNGDTCSAINGPRTFNAEFICGESFFSILSVTEPSVCNYHVQVETYLLCQNQTQTYRIPPPPKNIYCILIDKDNK